MTDETLDAIASEISTCTLCALHQGRTQTVPGQGSDQGSIMFIGEAPGKSEDEQGVPFVGRSGQYLNYLLNLINLDRSSVFITNVVKCRPPGNRDPEQGEIAACKTYLDRQVALIDPEVIVLVGRFAMARYFPASAKISKIHGEPKFMDNRAFYPIYHPAAALRNPGLRRDMEADFKRLLDVIEEVKQRRASDNFEAPLEDTPNDEEPPEQLTLL
ncbi:MAG: uracil-DNA glycosylase [Chloroflexota bacterium]